MNSIEEIERLLDLGIRVGSEVMLTDESRLPYIVIAIKDDNVICYNNSNPRCGKKALVYSYGDGGFYRCKDHIKKIRR